MEIKEQGHKPSQEKRWEKYYPAGFQEILSQKMPRETLWQYVERELKKDQDEHDAIVYFGRHIKRSELIESVYQWARMLKGMGIIPGDEILFFCPTIPEALYLLFAANMIGAVVIMPNLSSARNVLPNTVGNAKVAFVVDVLEDMLTDVLAKDQFKHVIVLDATTSMKTPLKQILGLANGIKNYKARHREKYITLKKALKEYGNYHGTLQAPCEEGKPVFMFSSGGTSVHGRAKQIGMSNRGMLNMVRSGQAFCLFKGSPFVAGGRCLVQLPPFVCTGLVILMIFPLVKGMTVYMDPRLNQDNFIKQILKVKPQITLVPGRLWEGFFMHIEKMIAEGQNPDLSFFVMPIMGGEGCTPEALKAMNEVLIKCNAPSPLISGYGMTEVFGVASLDFIPGVFERDYSRWAISVGYPMLGVTVGVFDEQGNELGYNQRGELWIKSPSMSTGYYHNQEATKQVMVDGWVHSGDYAEIGDDGKIYIYGRMQQHVKDADGNVVYLFDIANQLRQDPAVRDSIVCSIEDDPNDVHVVAHLTLNDDCQDSEETIIVRLEKMMKETLPKGLKIDGYRLYHGLFEVSLVCKKNRNYYRKIYDGYLIPENGKLKEVSFKKIESNK